MLTASGGFYCWANGQAAEKERKEPASNAKTTVRCAVIGGMTDTGFWQAAAERFEKQTGFAVEVVVTGPKYEIAGPFRRGEADLITMHASDTIINLVADGHGVDPQPWARNDLFLVGPKDDPAKIKGMTDAVAALEKIIEAKSKLLIHQSLGVNEVLHDLLSEGDLELDPENTVIMPSDRQRKLLQRAARENAYTLVGRIPFLNGKISNEGLEIMVQGDARMRRPYVVVVASANKADSPRGKAARQLAEFLRTPETQRWIGEFGRGQLDDRPLFFPVVVSENNGAAARVP
jgi:tungstate transport system substrate-binding protein